MSEDATTRGTAGDDADSANDSLESGETESAQSESSLQSEAFRRQQLYVGTGVSALAGVAVFVASLQQFPSLPDIVYVLFGLATTTLLFGLLVASMFTGDPE